jgi:hypothetical protein
MIAQNAANYKPRWLSAASSTGIGACSQRDLFGWDYERLADDLCSPSSQLCNRSFTEP